MLTVYTDGGARPNPGPGGWAAVVLAPDAAPRELSGGADHTTNNRMELTAAIRALEALPAGAELRLVTDSQYLRLGITRWLSGWRARGWRRADGGKVENDDLWRRLAALAGERSIDWAWVRGHAGDRWNERADALAREEIAARSGPVPSAAAAPVDARIYLRVSCAGGAGGWAARVRHGDGDEELRGSEAGATANRLDLLAAAAALATLPAGSRVAVYTGSDYLRHGATRWLAAWRRRGWKTREGRPVAHRDAWEQLDRELGRRAVTWPPAGEPDAEAELAALETAAREARAAAR